MNGPVLDIHDLSVNYRTKRGLLQALRNINLQIQPGRIVGIVGESGCGKSTLISAIIRLLAPNATIHSGSVLWRGRDLFTLSSSAMREIRGNEISMVFQDPMTSLNPVLSIGRQMTDIQHRDRRSKADKRARAARMLGRVDIPSPEQQLGRFPHHLSGGMRQRVAIAMALMTEPGLLIADEPTTALDATLEAQIIHRLQKLQSEAGCAVLFISHHLGVIAELCEEVVVMYAGEVVEHGPTRDVFLSPRHPYTQKLLECDPARIEKSDRQLPVIDGQLPDLVDLPGGCIFRDRCDRAVDLCREQRPQPNEGAHVTSCHKVPS